MGPTWTFQNLIYVSRELHVVFSSPLYVFDINYSEFGFGSYHPKDFHILTIHRVLYGSKLFDIFYLKLNINST